MRDEGVDIVVTAEGRRLLAVEVKQRGNGNDAVEQLKRFMEAMAYPLGMLVVGRELRLLRRDFGTGAIEEVGRYNTTGIELLDPGPTAAIGRDAAFVFEANVQRWLEALSNTATVQKLPEPLRSALAEWVLPELEVGEIRATGPRPLARVG